MHFARSIVLGYHSIPKIKWGSFRGRREEKWGSFRGRFGDHFRVGDHFGVGIISGAVQIFFNLTKRKSRIAPLLQICNLQRSFLVISSSASMNCSPMLYWLFNVFWLKVLHLKLANVHQYKFIRAVQVLKRACSTSSGFIILLIRMFR